MRLLLLTLFLTRRLVKSQKGMAHRSHLDGQLSRAVVALARVLQEQMALGKQQI